MERPRMQIPGPLLLAAGTETAGYFFLGAGNTPFGW